MKKVKYPGRKTSKICGRADTEKSKTLLRGIREDLNNREYTMFIGRWAQCY